MATEKPEGSARRNSETMGCDRKETISWEKGGGGCLSSSPDPSEN